MAFMDNLDDPKQQMLLALAMGLLGGRGGKGARGFGQDLSQAGLLGLNQYAQAQQMQNRNSLAKQEQEMRAMQMADLQRGNQFNEALRGGYQPGVTPSTPNDDQGYPMPRSAPGMDFSKAMQIDPMRGFQAQQAFAQMNQKQGPQYKEVGGRLVAIGPDGAVKEAYAPPEKPAFQPGQTREIKAGRYVYTQEWDGKGWKQIAKSAMDKPEGPEKGPTAPPGYRFTSTGNLEAITGGPADIKIGKEAEALKKRTEGALARADFVLGNVKEAIGETGVTTAGPLGAITRNIPGTGGYNLNKKLDSIRSNIGFAELQAMREASPTGGALGQVAVQELNMLQSVLGSLDTAQSPQQLEKALYSIEKHYTNWKRTVQQSQGPSVDDLVKKYGGQ